MYVYGLYEYDMHNDGSRRSAWAVADGRTGTGNLRPGRRDGGLGAVDYGTEAGRAESCQTGPYCSNGHGARLPETDMLWEKKDAGTQGGPQRRATRCTGADRRAARASLALLSALPRGVAALPGDPFPLHRGHPQRHHSGSDGAHHSPRLVSALQEAGRTRGPRRLAEGHPGQSYAGHDRLVALRFGEYPLADHRRVQLPSAT